VDGQNEGVLDEQLWATAFIAHTYQWPVVGWMSDIEHWTMEDLKTPLRDGIFAEQRHDGDCRGCDAGRGVSR